VSTHHRFSLALYRQMGVTDLVAEDAEHFLQLAHRLAHDPGFRELLVGRLVAAHDNITRHHEAALEWEQMLLRVGLREEPPQ
jgi:predicted O-linked N-acetylglucosamine transferase (SPINDLY family)